MKFVLTLLKILSVACSVAWFIRFAVSSYLSSKCVGAPRDRHLIDDMFSWASTLSSCAMFVARRAAKSSCVRCCVVIWLTTSSYLSINLASGPRDCHLIDDMSMWASALSSCVMFVARRAAPPSFVRCCVVIRLTTSSYLLIYRVSEPRDRHLIDDVFRWALTLSFCGMFVSRRVAASLFVRCCVVIRLTMSSYLSINHVSEPRDRHLMWWHSWVSIDFVILRKVLEGRACFVHAHGAFFICAEGDIVMP